MLLDEGGRPAVNGLFHTPCTREEKLAQIKRTPHADFPAKVHNRCLSNHQVVTRTKWNISSEKVKPHLQIYVLNQSHTTLVLFIHDQMSGLCEP